WADSVSPWWYIFSWNGGHLFCEAIRLDHVATTKNKNKIDALHKNGADYVIIDNGQGRFTSKTTLSQSQWSQLRSGTVVVDWLDSVLGSSINRFLSRFREWWYYWHSINPSITSGEAASM